MLKKSVTEILGDLDRLTGQRVLLVGYLFVTNKNAYMTKSRSHFRKQKDSVLIKMSGLPGVLDQIGVPGMGGSEVSHAGNAEVAGTLLAEETNEFPAVLSDIELLNISFEDEKFSVKF